MKIGIISDTHGKLHPPVLELIASCDVVLHAGDVDNSQTLDQLWMHLKPNAPFYLVRGNNDRGWKDAMKMVAKDRGISKREVYQGLLD